jgi:hypothetical protein
MNAISTLSRATAASNFQNAQYASQMRGFGQGVLNASGKLGDATSIIDQLINAVLGAAPGLSKGQALRELDRFTGNARVSNSLLTGQVPTTSVAPNGQAAAGAKSGQAAQPVYTDQNLYGPSGPRPEDIQQNTFGTCYFVATLAAVAGAKPNTIRNAISYDAKTQSFNVTLYNTKGKPQVINVTQADIAENVALGGSSTMDNTGKSERSWPAVMEAAWAKMKDSDPSNGLAEGYEARNGGFGSEGMQAITGSKGTNVSQGYFESDAAAVNRMAKEVAKGLKAGKPVTLSTDPERRTLWEMVTGNPGKQDGLVDNHVYRVESIVKDANGEWQVTVRNPWGQNNAGEGFDTDAPTMTVPLSRLVETGGLEDFQIGK